MMTIESALMDLLVVGSVWFVAAVVPGPEVLAIIHATATGGRRRGLATVAGIVTGTVVWGLAGYAGISAIFEIAPWSYLLLKLGGGAYLAILGIRLLRAGGRTESAESGLAGARSGLGAWGRGLAINLANPETAVLVASIYAVSLPPEPGLVLGAAVVALISLISLGWYCVLVAAVAAGRSRSLQRDFAGAIERVAAIALVALGLRLMLSR